jgi:ribonucleotide monophosphatase NagD (HAD superfamily)
MICGNPDLEVIRGGVRVLCAGALAVRYQELGGDVRSLGKPDPAIYQPVLAQLAMPKDRVLAVGDSLRTDIAGATAVGLATCWVLDGLHGEGLRDANGTYDPAAVEAAARAAGMAPVAAMARFNW